MDDAFTAADLEQLDRHGLPEDRARRQLALVRDPPSRLQVMRPATVDDGILRIDASRHDELLELYREAESRGRFSKFVPASGAASRMFRSLAAVRCGIATKVDEEACERFLRHLDRLPFAPELYDFLNRRGTSRDDAGALLAAFLDDDALAYARRPKGLVPFHRYDDPPEVRTPFEEHLAEAAGHVRDGRGRCRVHFTILGPHEERFRRFWDEVRPRLEARFSAEFEVEFSIQEPATDTVAAGLDGRPFRDRDSRLVIRPGGHGSLIENLGRIDGDLVFIKNVDNVLPDGRREAVIRWKKLLGGLLLDLERRLDTILERADRDEAGWTQDALYFLSEAVRSPARPRSPEGLRHRLDRPLRVCGVVPAAGEPGGGPFWIRDAHDGESLQIVETSQIDISRPDQAEIVAASTHFNPVDLVCRLRDHHGRHFDLGEFVDRHAVFISRKSYDGRPLRALEHPGLWNGAMARWNTVFVEVPAATFAPVKTVLDLLRPEHQP